MRKIYFIACLLFVIHFSLHSSEIKTFYGTILDGSTKKGIPYANIVETNGIQGTISNGEGEFVLKLKDIDESAELKVSSIGYKSKIFRVNQNSWEKMEIRLEPVEYGIGEVKVYPESALTILKRAISKIEVNYADSPFTTTGFYNELLTENENYITFTEAVVGTYNRAFGDTLPDQFKLIRGRARNNPGQIQFMKAKREKQNAKAKLKVEVKSENSEDRGHSSNADSVDVASDDSEMIDIDLGGPENIIKSDPVRDFPDFFEEEHFKKFNYSIAGTAFYDGHELTVIHVESRRTIDHMRIDGKVFIDSESDAIAAVEMDVKPVIPFVAKPILFAVGISLKDMQFFVTNHYRQIGDKWYFSACQRKGSLTIKKRYTFKKNEESKFYVDQAYVITSFDTDNPQPIPEEEQMDMKKKFASQLEGTDEDIWEDHNIIKPKRILE